MAELAVENLPATVHPVCFCPFCPLSFVTSFEEIFPLASQSVNQMLDTTNLQHRGL